MWALLLSATFAADVRYAQHTGRWTGSAMEWRSRYSGSPARAGLPALQRHRTPPPVPDGVEVTLSTPLPPYSIVTGATPIRGASGEILALRLEGEEVTVVQPGDRLPTTLRPPSPAGDVVNRVTLDGLAFDPDESGGWYRHIATVRQEGVSTDECRAARLVKDDGIPVCFTADSAYAHAGGLVGSLRVAGAPTGRVAVAAGVSFLLLLGLAALGPRLLRPWLREEAREAWFRRDARGEPPG